MKLYPVLVAALLSSSLAMGQRLGGNHNEDVGSVNTGFGLKGGLNVASVYKTSSNLESEGITGYHFGAYAKFGLSEKIGLQLEALYSRRGADLKHTFEDPDFGEKIEFKTKYRFDYIDVPLLLTYDIIGDNTLTIMAGPQASLMLTAKEQDNEIDKVTFHTFDMGAAAGLQFGYKFLRVGARYNVGFLDVINKQDADTENFVLSPYNFKNHFGQVYLGVEF